MVLVHVTVIPNLAYRRDVNLFKTDIKEDTIRRWRFYKLAK